MSNNNNGILNRNCLTNEERVLMESVAHSEPETCATRFWERLNRSELRKTVPVSLQTVKDELKFGGGLLNGKLKGYRVPSEKHIRRFLQSRGIITPDEFQRRLAKVAAATVTTSTTTPPHVAVEQKVVESSAEAEKSCYLTDMAMGILIALRSQSWTMRGLISKIKKDCSCGHKRISDAMDDLVDKQIIRKVGAKSYDLNLTAQEIEEFYPEIKHHLWCDFKSKLMSPKNRRIEKEMVELKKQQVVEVPSIESITKWLDDGAQYCIQNMAKHFNLPYITAWKLHMKLAEDGYIERLSNDVYAPTYIWQEKGDNNHPTTPTATVEKTCVGTSKDIVLKGCNVRIVNKVGKQLTITIHENEVEVVIG